MSLQLNLFTNNWWRQRGINIIHDVELSIFIQVVCLHEQVACVLSAGYQVLGGRMQCCLSQQMRCITHTFQSMAGVLNALCKTRGDLVNTNISDVGVYWTEDHSDKMLLSMIWMHFTVKATKYEIRLMVSLWGTLKKKPSRCRVPCDTVLISQIFTINLSLEGHRIHFTQTIDGLDKFFSLWKIGLLTWEV